MSMEPIRPSPLFIFLSNWGHKVLRRLGWIDFAIWMSADSVTVKGVDFGGPEQQVRKLRFPIATVLKRDILSSGATAKNPHK